MGVVRREGDWRLEKREEGVYEVTYQKNVELKIQTSDYQPGVTDITAVDVVPVREVDSYSEAEALFEERARGGPPDEGTSSGGGSGRSLRVGRDGSVWVQRDRPHSNDGGDPPDSVLDVKTRREGADGFGYLPPGGIALALLAAGAVVSSSVGVDWGSTTFLFGSIVALGGLAIFGWAAMVYRARGWPAARSFLMNIEDPGGNR